MNAYDGCIPVTVYMVQEYVGVCIFGKWVNIKGFSDKEKAEALMWLLEHETKHKSKKTMTTEESKRMLALSRVLADLKAENMALRQHIQNISSEFADVLCRLNEKEKRMNEGSSTEPFVELQQMREQYDKLEGENRKLKFLAKGIHSFVKEKNLYIKKDDECPYCRRGITACSPYCRACGSCLSVIECYGVICEKRLKEANVSLPDND